MFHTQGNPNKTINRFFFKRYIVAKGSGVTCSKFWKEKTATKNMLPEKLPCRIVGHNFPGKQKLTSLKRNVKRALQAETKRH